jgi:spore maturation protein A
MLNIIWLILVLGSIIIGAINGTIPAVVNAVTDSAASAVVLAFGLIGIMALWLGLMRIAEDAGLIRTLSKIISPLLRFLFPQIPRDHPVFGAMTLNISANVLGLANAATPFGLKAMEELSKLNKTPGTASDAMCMFVAINTGSVQLIPATAIAILASAGDPSPTSIIIPVLIATACATTTGILSAKWFSKMSFFKIKPEQQVQEHK